MSNTSVRPCIMFVLYLLKHIGHTVMNYKQHGDNRTDQACGFRACIYLSTALMALSGHKRTVQHHLNCYNATIWEKEHL